MSDRRKSAFSSLASTSAHAQLPDALIEWVNAQPSVSDSPVDTRKDVQGLDDLKDGIALGQVLLETCVSSAPSGRGGGQSAPNLRSRPAISAQGDG